jgi:hypothetical protein
VNRGRSFRIQRRQSLRVIQALLKINVIYLLNNTNLEISQCLPDGIRILLLFPFVQQSLVQRFQGGKHLKFNLILKEINNDDNFLKQNAKRMFSLHILSR